MRLLHIENKKKKKKKRLSRNNFVKGKKESLFLIAVKKLFPSSGNLGKSSLGVRNNTWGSASLLGRKHGELENAEDSKKLKQYSDSIRRHSSVSSTKQRVSENPSIAAQIQVKAKRRFTVIEFYSAKTSFFFNEKETKEK